MTRREPLSRQAIRGVIALVVVAAVCVLAGVQTLRSMGGQKSKSMLERFAAGLDHPNVVTLGDPSARIVIGLPAAPLAAQREAFTYVGQVNSLDRVTSGASSGSVQV